MATKNEILAHIDQISDRRKSGVSIKGAAQVGVFDFQKFVSEFLDIVEDVVAHAPVGSPANLAKNAVLATTEAFRSRAISNAQVRGVEQKGPLTPKMVRRGDFDALVAAVAATFFADGSGVALEVTGQKRQNGSVLTDVRTSRGAHRRRARTYREERDLALSRLRELVVAAL